MRAADRSSGSPRTTGSTQSGIPLRIDSRSSIVAALVSNSKSGGSRSAARSPRCSSPASTSRITCAATTVLVTTCDGHLIVGGHRPVACGGASRPAPPARWCEQRRGEPALFAVCPRVDHRSAASPPTRQRQVPHQDRRTDLTGSLPGSIRMEARISRISAMVAGDESADRSAAIINRVPATSSSQISSTYPGPVYP